MALAAAVAGVTGVGSFNQAQAHDVRRFAESDKLPSTAELVLPELRAGTYRLIVRANGESRFVGSFEESSGFEPEQTTRVRPSWRDRSPMLRLRVPDEPAPRRVVKPTFQVRPGAVDTFTVPKNFATIDAPRRVEARKRFQAGWSGPNVSGDRLELLANGQRACANSVLGISVHEYDVNRDGEFTFLAPLRAGSYELVYCSANQQRVLARHPIQVVPAKVATVRTDRVSRFSPEETTREATRPSFELNSSVDDDTMPRVRMLAPLASARVDTLDDDKPMGPVFSVRPKLFVEDDSDQTAISTPVGRFRFKERRLAQSEPAQPSFSVRPKFESDEEERSDEPDFVENRENVIDITPRRRPTFTRELPKLTPEPRVRVFIDEEPADFEEPEPNLREAKRRSFSEEDAFARRVERQVEEPEQEERQALKRRQPSFEDEEVAPRSTARRPTFEGDEFGEATTRRTFDDEEKSEPEVREARRPTFDDDSVREDRTVKREPQFEDDSSFEATQDNDKTDLAKQDGEEDRFGTEKPVKRADDFKSDEVNVASAIARNRARYGDGASADDEFFSIKGRYSWYKPVQPGQTATLPSKFDDAEDNVDDASSDRRRANTRDDSDDVTERDDGRVIELKGRDEFDRREFNKAPIIASRPKTNSEIRERDFDEFASTRTPLTDDSETFGPPVDNTDRRFASRNTDADPLGNDTDFDASSRTGAATGPIEMVRKTDNNQVAPQFDRIQSVKAGYRFAAGWTGDIRRKGWIAVARKEARIGDYLSLRSAEKAGELKFRAPSEPGRYELRFLSRDRRVVLARQSFEVEPAPVRLVALEFVDPSDELNVWWAGPGDGSDSLTLARVGAQDSRYLSKQSVGKGNPLTLKAPTQPGTYEMRYVNGTDNRVLFRRKLVVAESQPTLLGP